MHSDYMVKRTKKTKNNLESVLDNTLGKEAGKAKKSRKNSKDAMQGWANAFA